MPGGLFANYQAFPIILVVPAIAFLGAMLTLLLLRAGQTPRPYLHHLGLHGGRHYRHRGRLAVSLPAAILQQSRMPA